MENFTQRQHNFLENFLKHSSKVLELGFAYLFSHPEHIASIDNEIQKLRSMERLQMKFPSQKVYCQRIMRQVYIEYIVKVTKFGFMYVKANPQAYREIAQLQKLFGEYNNLREDEAMVGNRQEKNEMHDESSSDDPIWEETFKQINDLNKKLEALQVKVKFSPFLIACDLKSSRDQLKKINDRLEKKLKDIDDKKSKRRQREIPVECPSSCQFPSENMVKINEVLENDLRERNIKKQPNIPKGTQAFNKFQQPPKDTYVVSKPRQHDTFNVKKPDGTFVVKKPKGTYNVNKPKGTYFVNKSKSFDSDNDSSEQIISVDHFSNLLTTTMPLKDIKKNLANKKPPNAGPIERNIIIPVQTENNPTITPRFYFKKSPVTGQMQVDLKLNFDDGIMYQNKLVHGICIENALPVQNFRNKK